MRAILWLVAFMLSSEPAIDHPTTPPPLPLLLKLPAVCDRTKRAHPTEPRRENNSMSCREHSMQRTCLPPADYKTTTLPPSSSSSRQHHARVAGPRCALGSCCVGACDRSPDHTTTTTSLCRCLLCDRVSYNTTLLSA